MGVTPSLLSGLRTGRGPLLAAIAYFCGAQLAFLIGTLSDRIFAPFWPPNVILFCALLLVPYRRWWIYLAAVFPAHVLAELTVQMPLPQMLVAFATNCSVALLNAAAVRHFLGGPPWFADLRKAGLYIIATAGVAPAVSAVGGAFVPILGGGSVENYWTYWAHWYVANALPGLTIGPLFLAWHVGGLAWAKRMGRRRQIEAVLVAGALLLVCLSSFRFSGKAVEAGLLPVLLYAPLPLVLWATVRFGERGASAAIVTVTLITVWTALNGPSPFSDQDPEKNVLALQAFLIVVSVPVILLGALVDELRRTGRITRDLAHSLLHIRDEEGRQLAKGLQDSIAQDLVAALLLVHQLRFPNHSDAESTLKELDDMLRRAIDELLTTSYFLHPLVLDEGGLAIALRDYVEAFVERSNITVELEVADEIERLPAEAELAIFRVVQEALTNVYRSSNRMVAKIRIDKGLSPNGHALVLRIEQEASPSGAYTPADPSPSIELSSMRERMNRIGGSLEILALPQGTTIQAVVPLKRTSES